MEIVLYERPREKLRNRGIGFLSLAELIQLVIGSGSSKLSGAKLSRQVETLMKNNTLTYESLMSISGIGEAKACQLLAAIEIGCRLNALSSQDDSDTSKEHALYIKEASHYPNTLYSVWFDGSGQFIRTTQHMFNKKEHYSVLVKRLYTDGINVSARSVLIIASLKRSTLEPDTLDLSLIQNLCDTAHILGITVKDIYAVHKQLSRRWSNIL